MDGFDLTSQFVAMLSSGLDSSGVWVLILLRIIVFNFRGRRSSLLSLPTLLAVVRAGLTFETGSQELYSGLPCDWQGPSYWSLLHWLPGPVLTGWLSQEPVPEIEPRFSSVGSGDLNCQMC